MATESPIRMLESDESKWPSTMDTAMFTSPFSNMAGHEDLNKVLNESSVLREQTSTVPNRSGSAPPTVGGSIASLRTFMDQWNSPLTTSENWFLNFESEEQMRTHPAYIAYYYANVNLNPRLPPPLISQENRNLVRIMRTSGRNKLTSVTEVSLAAHREEPEEDKSLQQRSGDAMKASSGTAIEEDDHGICTASTADQSPKMQESFSSSANVHGDVDPLNSTVTASASSTDFPTTTLYPKIAESLDNMSTRSNVGSDISVLESRMESLNVSGELEAQSGQKTHNNANSHYQYRLPTHPSQNPMSPVPVFHGNVVHEGMHGLHGGMEKLSALYPKPLLVQTFMHTPGNIGPVPPLYTATTTYVNSGNLYHPILRPPGLPSPQFMSTTASVFQPPYFGGNLQNEVPVDPYSPAGMFKQPMEGSMVQMNPYANQLLYWSKTYPLHELMMRPSYRDSSQRQYCQQPVHDARMTAIQHDQLSKGQFDVLPLQKNSDIATMMGDKELRHPVANENLGMSAPTNGSHLRFNYYGHPPSLALPHFSTASTMVPGSPMAGSNHPGPNNDVIASQHSPKNTVSSSDWEWQRGSDDSKRHSFLELVKSCNSRKLELSDISGKIIEFSTDQHGSRFIQQKLEHCAIDEKESVFKEVIPHASKLMNDVFGNYVIQKFFEHGNAEQRRKLGEQLVGKILPLSLQMYGCRVIQKALEVLELDQKTELIQELNGHVMRCVHDQNGNHVIQKCIESVPTEKVGFIISSFRGQVAALSSHPYGCRVIQRVLQHCSNEQICRWIVDEILESACDLAQDPYGNYVTQHVLEMSKLRERSQIIRSLTGKFIQMSQHKYASNVVEKCLKYGDASERNLIIEEIVVQPNNDDSLLCNGKPMRKPLCGIRHRSFLRMEEAKALEEGSRTSPSEVKMMKDQFGNYVAQKIFDMGNDKQKDILLKCIQIHLSALKKFPYAKQIVARYEQLSEGSAEEQKQ